MVSKMPVKKILCAIALLGSGFPIPDTASASQCPSGEIYRVSLKTCISRRAAVEQGIIGGHRGGSHVLLARAAPAGDSPGDAALSLVSASPKQVDSRQTGNDEPQQMPDFKVANQASSSAIQAPSLKIEIVKTEPAPVPAILLPTWPFGELPTFPRRAAP